MTCLFYLNFVLDISVRTLHGVLHTPSEGGGVWTPPVGQEVFCLYVTAGSRQQATPGVKKKSCGKRGAMVSAAVESALMAQEGSAVVKSALMAQEGLPLLRVLLWHKVVCHC